MLLKTTLIREGGSFHEIDGKKYHFAPQVPDGGHVCEVTIPAHVKRFLSIDGFEIADDVFAPIETVPLTPAEDAELAALVAKGPGPTIVLPQSDNEPIVMTGINAPWTPPSEGQPPAWTPPVVSSILDGVLLQMATPVAAPDYDAMTDDELDAAFLSRFGKQPHPRAKRAKIIETLRKPEATEAP